MPPQSWGSLSNQTPLSLRVATNVKMETMKYILEVILNVYYNQVIDYSQR
jgi:hypothetical protein